MFKRTSLLLQSSYVPAKEGRNKVRPADETRIFRIFLPWNEKPVCLSCSVAPIPAALCIGSVKKIHELDEVNFAAPYVKLRGNGYKW